MNITLSKHHIHHGALQTQALIFWPDSSKPLAPTFAFLTHGYTASKTDQFNWAARLAEEGITTFLFDLPGHYLGGLNEVERFSDFELSHELFSHGLELIRADFFSRYPLYEHFNDPTKITIILGGHSLGALFALKALKLSAFKDYGRLAIAVGFGHGLAPDANGVESTHLFQTAMFKSTLHLRSQLVSPALHPDVIFPWIKKEKDALSLPGERIHLITGEDDVVVARDGAERMRDQLEKSGAQVTLERPSKLSHHEPAAAASYIKSFLRKNKYF